MNVFVALRGSISDFIFVFPRPDLNSEKMYSRVLLIQDANVLITNSSVLYTVSVICVVTENEIVINHRMFSMLDTFSENNCKGYARKNVKTSSLNLNGCHLCTPTIDYFVFQVAV